MDNRYVIESAIKGRGYSMSSYPWNVFSTPYYNAEYKSHRDMLLDSFLQRVHNRVNLDEYSPYRYKTSLDSVSLWEDAVDNIDKIIDPQSPLTKYNMVFDTYKPLNYPTTVLLRGNYSMGRNLFVKRMGMYDAGALVVSIDNFTQSESNYQFSVFPLFGTITIGYFRENFPFNIADKWYHKDYTIKDYLDIITFIHEHEDFKRYNIIVDGNIFQPYLNKVYELIKPYMYTDNRRYFDLYVLNDYMLDYLTTPVLQCYYQKYGWNKYPFPDDEFCTLFDNLEGASKKGILSYYIPFDKEPDNTLYKLLTGEISQIEHYKNKPILP